MITDLQGYLSKEIENIMKDSLRVTFDNPRETAFLVKFAAASAKAARKRDSYEKAGEHIPPFLIASITRDCNLHCAGCYARANNCGSAGCGGSIGQAASPEPGPAPKAPMTAEDWDRVFSESAGLGISFIFLVGGEPMLCRDVIEKAGEHRSILFPIITNGIFMDDDYLKLYDRCRNLLPIISIEGGEASTDGRRGAGIYQILLQVMGKLKAKGLPFGVSITATTGNLEEITDTDFIQLLRDSGCRMVLYVDYVATGEDDKQLEPDDAHRERMDARLDQLRQDFDRMVFLAFPGDEKEFGGCLAAGRGFFHISAEGDAEPCPFAPFSDINVRETSVREAIRSRLFARLEERDMLQEDHSGGCALAGKGAQVRELLK